MTLSYPLLKIIVDQSILSEAVSCQHQAKFLYFVARTTAEKESDFAAWHQEEAARCSLRARKLMGIEE